MSKVHLARDQHRYGNGWWCKKDQANEPRFWVSTKEAFLKISPLDRCARCGLFRDLDEFKRKGGETK